MASASMSRSDTLVHHGLPRRSSDRRAPHRKTGRLACVSASTTSQPSISKLNEGIAHFYDSTSPVWENLWGEHMHHGFYNAGMSAASAFLSDHRAAQIRMIEECLAWAEISDKGNSRPQRILDVGCGIGGSSRYLARRYGAHAVGITLSPLQAKRAVELTSIAGLSDKVQFQVADALSQPFPDEQFDFVWSMESGEHMPDKKKFMSELVRVTKPGGKILIVTWCHRELLSNEKSVRSDELMLLDQLCESYYLPAWCAPSKYVEIAHSMGLEGIKCADWSDHITPFWPAVIASAFSLKGILGLFTSGWTTVKGAIAMANMVRGYNIGLIKFALITAQKPS